MRRMTFVAALIVGMAVLALILSERVLPIEVWATPGKEKEQEKEEREIVELDLWEKVEHQEKISEPVAGEVEPPPTPVVFIDAGHGGNDGGCVEGNTVEKNINLSIAGLVQDKLALLYVSSGAL